MDNNLRNVYEFLKVFLMIIVLIFKWLIFWFCIFCLEWVVVSVLNNGKILVRLNCEVDM